MLVAVRHVPVRAIVPLVSCATPVVAAGSTAHGLQFPATSLARTRSSYVAPVENVRSTVNELAVTIPTSMSSRSNDSLLTGKVKATFIDAKDLQVNAFKVITERGNVYLMGRVTEREAARATDLARTVSGVQKVVRVFEIVTEAELAEITPK